MGEWMNGYMEKLAALRQANLDGGGPERRKALRALGKLGARDRIEQLTDAGSFEEIGSAVTDASPPYDGLARPTPSDGVVMGLARVENRPVALYATDFTVMSGAIGDQAAWKLADLTQMAGQMQIPIIGLVDSAGERLELQEWRFRPQRPEQLHSQLLPLLGHHTPHHSSVGPLHRGICQYLHPVRLLDHQRGKRLPLAGRRPAIRSGRRRRISNGKKRSMRSGGRK